MVLPVFVPTSCVRLEGCLTPFWNPDKRCQDCRDRMHSAKNAELFAVKIAWEPENEHFL